MDYVYDTVLKTALSATGALAAGLFAQYATRRQKQLEQKSSETARSVADIVQRREAQRRTDLVEKVVEKLPQGMTPEQFLAALEPVVAKLATVTTPPAAEVSAVEELISSYHEQALSQAKVQFWFSVIAATIGFVWILYTGAQIEPKDLATAGKTLPGIAMDAVAFLFFRQAAETRQRATELYDRLRNDRKVTDSVVLVASIEDVKVRSAVKAQIALHMAGLAPSPISLTSFIGSGSVTGIDTPEKKSG